MPNKYKTLTIIATLAILFTSACNLEESETTTSVAVADKVELFAYAPSVEDVIEAPEEQEQEFVTDMTEQEIESLVAYLTELEAAMNEPAPAPVEQAPIAVDSAEVASIKVLQNALGVAADGQYGAGTREAHARAVVAGTLNLQSYADVSPRTPVLLDSSYPEPVRAAYLQMTGLAEPMSTVLIFDPSQQLMYVMKDLQVVTTYQISSGVNGIGNTGGSWRTPIGYFTIDKYKTRGVGAVDVDVPSGRLLAEHNVAGMTTYILQIDGRESSTVNNNANSFGRGIFIHGTNKYTSVTSQTPQSHGCLRMMPLDIIELYSLLDGGTSQLFTLNRSPF